MNAYELADYLEQDFQIQEAVIDMLKDQADRIAELEKDLALKTRDRDVFREFTLAYEKRIAELEKPIQDGIQSFGVLQEQMLKEKLFGAEPVAWMDKNGVPSTIKSDLYSIPLYTTPQIKERCEPLCKPSVCNCIKKELSDEEIKECADSVCHAWKKNGVGELYMGDFAKAILKKASEK